MQACKWVSMQACVEHAGKHPSMREAAEHACKPVAVPQRNMKVQDASMRARKRAST